MIRDLLRRPRVHRPADPVPAGSDTPRIAVLGAGAGGLCAGMRLRQAGIESFTIYEKADGVGGTWRDNTYPGACCDVMSHLYSFSFAPNPDWSRQFAEQPEILEYFERCADEHGLRPHLRFGTEIAAADWDEDDAVWRLRTAAGEELEADVVISGLGQLNRPFVPDIPGLAEFRGTAFHSARWRHDPDLTGARVAVVGSAANAVQFIPRTFVGCPLSGAVRWCWDGTCWLLRRGGMPRDNPLRIPRERKRGLLRRGSAPAARARRARPCACPIPLHGATG